MSVAGAAGRVRWVEFACRGCDREVREWVGEHEPTACVAGFCEDCAGPELRAAAEPRQAWWPRPDPEADGSGTEAERN